MDTNTASMAPPSGLPVPSPRRRMPTISAKVWKEQRPRFQMYYVDLDKSLPEAMKSMEDTYAFHASEKQYKTKIKQWNLTKYVNEDKMGNMLRKEKRRRTQEGKDTTFTLNGREVEHEKLVRFQKRRKLQDDEIGSSTVSTASRVQYCTPLGQSPYAALVGNSPDRTGSETGSSLAPSTITPGSRSTSTSGSVLLRLSWNGLDMRALRDMERRAYTLLMDHNPTEALEIYRQILAGYEHLLGPDVDDVLTTVNAMGRACMLLGNESEAEALLIRAVSGQESIHGPEHETSLTSVAELAYLYMLQGRFEDSEVLYLRAIKGLNQTLPSSEQYLRMFRNLAYLYVRQGSIMKARFWYKRVIAGYRSLGAGYEDALLHAEAQSCWVCLDDEDPATDSLLVDVLGKCEARSITDSTCREDVFFLLYAICKRCLAFQDFRKFALYDQRLRLMIDSLFGKEETISVQSLNIGSSVAKLYSLLRRYEEAESLFKRLKYKTDEPTSSQSTHSSAITRKRVQFTYVTAYAEHYVRQSKWEDAELLLLEAKSLERPFSHRFVSAALAKALVNFRNGSGREPGALPLAQHTPGTDIQSSTFMPGETTNDVDTLIPAGSADFQQPFEDLDWSGYPLPSPSVLSPQWSLPQPPTPQGAEQAGPTVEWENSDMMGMQDMVP